MTSKGNMGMRLHLLALSVLFLLMSTVFTGCDGHFLALDCIGAKGYCKGGPPPTPDANAAEAKERAIIAQKPIATDSLTKQDANAWDISDGCTFQNRALYINFTARGGGTYFCESKTLKYSNVAIALDATLVSGNLAGLILRSDTKYANLLEFAVGNGEILVEVWRGRNIVGEPIDLLHNPLVHKNGTANTLFVIAQGDDFQFFVNGSFIGEIHNPTIPASGLVGTVVDFDHTATGRFSNLAFYAIT